MNIARNSHSSEVWLGSPNPFAEVDPKNSGPADEELVSSALAGDKDSLEALVRRHQSWVFNISLRMLWRRDQAEDATQEILIKVVTKLSTFKGQSKFRTWLYRIAFNHLLNVDTETATAS
jgi:Sigma-70 region 2